MATEHDVVILGAGAAGLAAAAELARAGRKALIVEARGRVLRQFGQPHALTSFADRSAHELVRLADGVRGRGMSEILHDVKAPLAP